MKINSKNFLAAGKIEAPPRRQQPCDVGGSVIVAETESFTSQVNRGAAECITASDIMSLMKASNSEVQVKN